MSPGVKHFTNWFQRNISNNPDKLRVHNNRDENFLYFSGAKDKEYHDNWETNEINATWENSGMT